MAGSDLQFYLTWLKDQLKAQVKTLKFKNNQVTFENEHKHGKDEVVKVEAGPFGVVQFVGQKRGGGAQDAGRGGFAQFIQGVKNFIRAENPKHVEAAQGVEGDQPLGLGRGRNMVVAHGLLAFVSLNHGPGRLVAGLWPDGIRLNTPIFRG